jgi:energy-converting hydrogenase A subunit M
MTVHAERHRRAAGASTSWSSSLRRFSGNPSILDGMTTRTKKLALLLTGAVVLSSGAYALGSQSGDGGALASGSTGASGTSAAGTPATVRERRVGFGFGRGGPGGPGPHGDFGLDRLASRLGVSTTALRDALEATLRSKTPEQRRAQLAQELATALGKPAGQVQSALDSALPKPDTVKADLAAALAKELGVDTAKVQAALDKVRDDLRARGGPGGRRDRGDRRDAAVSALASELGIDAAKVRDALDKVRDDVRTRFRDRRGDRRDGLARLATALGVTQEQLRDAFDRVRAQERDAFATDLAQRLNIDAQKVKDVLADLPRFGFGFRRHG